MTGIKNSIVISAAITVALILSMTSALSGQTLQNSLGDVLSFSGTRSTGTFVGQVAFEPGDNNHVYVGTAGAGVLRYDYDPSGANASEIFSNQQLAVPTSTTNVGAVDGSLAVAFHEDPVLGNVMYIAPSVPFSGAGPNLIVQTIVRLTDEDNDGLWGEPGEVNQTIVDNVVVSRIHQINQMQILEDRLYVCIGIRTQNGGQTAAQNQAAGGSGVNQSDPGETAYTGTVSFIDDLTLLSSDTTTRNLAGFLIPGVNGATATVSNDLQVRTDIQPFISNDPSKLRVWATGFRNNYGIVIDEDEIWVTYNENENPQAPDKIQRNVTYQSHHLFFKANNQVGRWDVVGDEINGALTTTNQMVIDAGWFNPANNRPVFTTVGNNTAVGGLDYFPADFPVEDLQGDLLAARWSGSGQDVVHIDESTGIVTVVLEGLSGALEVTRDPFGNFIVGGNNAIGLLLVDDKVDPPVETDPNTIHLSLGEAGGVPDQQVINGDVWNNIVGASGTDSTLVRADGTSVSGISVTPESSSNGFNPNDGNGNGYIPGLNTVTQSLIFALSPQPIRVAARIEGLEVGSHWCVLVYAGLQNDDRTQDISINGGPSINTTFGDVYSSGQPVAFPDIEVGANGEILIEAIATGGGVQASFIQAVSLVPIEVSSFTGAHLAYGNSGFGFGPEVGFIFYPFSDAALFTGPNDITGGDPYDLFGGDQLPVDPADSVLNVDSLPEGTYSFLIQENQELATEYELEFIVVQAPGSKATGPTNDLIEQPGVDSISNDFANPDLLTLGLGSNMVIGEVGAPGSGTILADGSDNGTDGDYFTVVVPSGMVLDQLIINRYNQSQRGFLAFASGATFQPPLLQNAAIAEDKEPLIPGSQASFANYSSFNKGINRLVIDVTDLPTDGMGISVSDFTFRVGNNSQTETWVDAPAPSDVIVLPGFGEKNSDRIVVVWENGDILNSWLEVSVLANEMTGLPEDPGLGTGIANQFYFGNVVGESDTPNVAAANVDLIDVLDAWFNQADNATITNKYDFNRDAKVDFTDVVIPWINIQPGLVLITP